MNIQVMARSTLRPMRFMYDIEAFRELRGGHLGNTMHCARYLGQHVLWDAFSREFVSEEGLCLEGLDHLHTEFGIVHDLVQEATGHSASAYAVIIPVQQGRPRARIYDLIHPNLPLYIQVNLLADMFSALESTVPHTRPVQYFHTSSLNSEKRVTRWLKNWVKRPGCGGVMVKDMEFHYCPGEDAIDACCALAR